MRTWTGVWMLVFAVGGFLQGLQAAVIEWQGVSSTNWATDSSWFGGTAPANNAYEDTARFSTSSTNDPILTANRSVGTVIFERSVTVLSDATVRILTLTNGATATRLTLEPSCVVTMNVSVASSGGFCSSTLANGARLIFAQNAPAGGVYSLADNSCVGYTGTNVSGFASNPKYYGTGDLLLDATIGGPLRAQFYNMVRMTIGPNAAVSGSVSGNTLSALDTNTIVFQRDFDMRSLPSGALNVGVNASDKNRTVVTTLQSDGYTFSVNSVKFWGTENTKGKNPQLIMDGGIFQVGGVSNSELQGVLLTDHTGSLCNSLSVNMLTDLVVTLGSTTNGGVVRVDSSSTFSHCATNSLGEPYCYGALLLLTNSVTLINNGLWTNNNSRSVDVYTGLVVAAGATLGGTGVFDMGATTNGPNAKYAVVSGHLAPGETNAIGTLTVTCSNLMWNGESAADSSWIWDIGAGNTADKLKINGDFSKGSGSAFVFDLKNSDTTGTYEVVEWTGSSSFAADDFSVMNVRGIGSFEITGKNLYLIVDPPPPGVEFSFW